MLAVLLLPLLLSPPLDVRSAMAAGDEAFYKIDYPVAIASYESALGLEPFQADILWRLARTYVCMGEVAQTEQREAMFSLAEQYARRCIAIDSMKQEGHTWLAGALGYLALDQDVGRQVLLSRELHKEALRAIELDSTNDAAYSILGSFYRALGNIGWLKRSLASLFIGSIPPGGFQEAETALKKAVALAPDIMRHHYELGVLYLDMGRVEEARRALIVAAKLPVRTAIDRPRLAKIQELLKSLPSD